MLTFPHLIFHLSQATIWIFWLAGGICLFPGDRDGVLQVSPVAVRWVWQCVSYKGGCSWMSVFLVLSGWCLNFVFGWPALTTVCILGCLISNTCTYCVFSHFFKSPAAGVCQWWLASSSRFPSPWITYENWSLNFVAVEFVLTVQLTRAARLRAVMAGSPRRLWFSPLTTNTSCFVTFLLLAKSHSNFPSTPGGVWRRIYARVY